MAGDYKKNLIRSPLFDEYLAKEYKKLAPYEKLKISEALGKTQRTKAFIETYTMDRKLLLLTYMGKKFFMLIFDDKNAANFEDFQKVFNYYISAKDNYDSEEKRRQLNVFCLDQRAVAKHYIMGAFRFSDPVYKAAEDGTPFKFMSQFKTPNVAISTTERTERNFDVYKMFTKLLTKGFHIESYIQAYGIDYGHFKILINLFCAERPLTQDETLDKGNILNYRSRTDPSNQRLVYMVAHDYIHEHEYTDGEKKFKTYTISAKGLDVYKDIINVLLKDEN